MSEGDVHPSSPRRSKNMIVAASLSVLPGLGQLYNGQFDKALFFLMSTAASIGAAIGLIVIGDHLGGPLITRSFAAFAVLSLLSVVIFLGLFVLGLGFWASSIVDARQSAEELSRGVQARRRWWFLKL